jgi:hypothetical protein
MKDLVKDVVRTGRFTPVAPYQRFAYLCGALLVLSGAFHAVVYLVAGGPWEGPLSWRKPIVFGLSFGITLVTLTWLMSFLRVSRITGWITLGVFAVASIGEVFLISMQKWRGVASHFNEDTAFDAAVFSLMGLLVAVVALVTVFIAALSFLRSDAPPSLAWAIRAGLVLMLVSQAVGVQMIVEGGNTFGAAGALKVPHAFTLHALQVLPALAVLLQLSDSTERRRLKVVGLGAVGYGGLISSTMVQTYGGHSPLDPTLVTSILAVVGLALVVTSAVIGLRGLFSRPRAAIRPPGEPRGRPAARMPRARRTPG